MREIGIGLVGYGAMGKVHSYVYQTLPLYYQDLPFTVRLTGICSRRLEQARKAQADLGYAFATDDYDALLALPGIDVIDINHRQPGRGNLRNPASRKRTGNGVTYAGLGKIPDNRIQSTGIDERHYFAP